MDWFPFDNAQPTNLVWLWVAGPAKISVILESKSLFARSISVHRSIQNQLFYPDNLPSIRSSFLVLTSGYFKEDGSSLSISFVLVNTFLLCIFL